MPPGARQLALGHELRLPPYLRWARVPLEVTSVPETRTQVAGANFAEIALYESHPRRIKPAGSQ